MDRKGLVEKGMEEFIINDEKETTYESCNFND